ncbi:MAG: hypothetical protein KBT68_04475, partial [bacterium]|nr:hypothetical protein [Candidatus Colisoma equi]
MVMLVAGVAFGVSAETEELTGPDLWAQRASHPAVVNPVLGQDAANVISLRGEWEFMTRDEFGRNRPGPVCDWMWEAKPWPRKISVPGCWEAQGVGEPGMSDPWNIAIDHNAKPIRHRYMGVGCYRRTVDIPASWRGKRVWLKVGGAKSVAWFHVNGRHVACVDNFCGTYKYEITDLVAPGKKATIVAQVRNDVPSRKGLLSAMHRWGGLYRDVELEATPSVFIDDAWVRGDFDGRTAEVKVKVEGEQRNDSLFLRATVEGETREIAVHSSPSPSDFTLEVPLRNFRAWSPEHPNLYTGLVELVENGRVIHTRRERFGVRKLEVRGKEFYLNGRPYFFRGFGDDHVYPITGITPADIDVHRRHLALARKAGFNVVRLHTHTEIPEYFEAADELGILIEAELPYYNNEPPEGQSFDPKRDVTELWRHYRRHPSFGVYSMGNEGSFGGELDRALHRYVKAMDPDRLKINQDSSFAGNNPPESADYTGGPIKEWERGSFNPDRPFVNHEYLNLGAKLDSRLEPRFTGVWQPPVTRDGRRAWLETFGLDLAWGDRLQDASHALQAVYQKRGIESLRCDPYSDGYHFWTVVDVVVSNLCTYSAQGLLTPFWEPKSRGLSIEDFAVFNSPSCVLLDKALGNMIFTAGEAFSSDVFLAHYGDEALAGARLGWTLTADGRSLGTGSVPVGDQPVGAVRKVAEVSFKMPSVAHPVKATLSLTLVSQTSQAISNSWSCWIFPVREKRD